jgi:hypothetical protein
VASLQKSKKHLSFTALREALSAHINTLADPRQPSKRGYSQHDVVMSAFACMYFQDPSLAQFQMRMEEAHHKNNLRSLFHVENIPDLSGMSGISPVRRDLLGPARHPTGLPPNHV